MLKKNMFSNRVIALVFAFLVCVPVAQGRADGVQFHWDKLEGYNEQGQLVKAAHSADDIIALLADEGYYKISVFERKPPDFVFMACREGALYRLDVDQWGKIRDRKYEGDCGGQKKGTRVRAPFTDVQVDEGGVRVRAPFVDIWVPRR